MENFNNLVEKMKGNPPNALNPTTVKDWFLHHDVRVLEATDDPTSLLFLLSDVAKVIDDKNYRKFKSDELKKMDMNDDNGRKQNYLMLTEKGLYQYLIKSKRPAALPFQNFVFDLLKSIRKAVVTAAERELHAYQNNIRTLTNPESQKELGLDNLIYLNEIIQYCTELKLDIRSFGTPFLYKIDTLIKNGANTNDIINLLKNYKKPLSDLEKYILSKK